MGSPDLKLKKFQRAFDNASQYKHFWTCRNVCHGSLSLEMLFSENV